MVEYGYIENGYLRSRIIEPYPVIRTKENGESYTETISIEEQVSQLSKVWKPVAPIDPEKMKTEEGYIIVIVPYDAGDHIDYHYVKKEDLQAVKNEISSLKKELADTDYQVIKCYEASLLGEEMPYPYKSLIKERQATREKINLLQDKLALIKL